MARFRELMVYQKAYELVVSLYKFSKEMPEDERFGLTSQLKRAAFGIPVNIAEGYGKEDSRGELIRFLRMAKGSASELGVLIDICHDVGYMEDRYYEKYRERTEEIARMLHGLIEKLSKLLQTAN